MEILLFLFVSGALIFYFTAKPATTNIDELDDPRYRAVKIKPCKNACQAASQTTQIIFLASQAPKLPLNACDRIAECDCQFRHFADRWQQQDRRTDSYVAVYGAAAGSARGKTR
ncbi:MAG: hypothetical protein RQ732_01220 [Methylophaga sp.]|nr:hypothetical protein [Methylophaga sp.]